MPIGFCHIRTISKLQPPSRLPPVDRVQNPRRLQLANFQQRRIRAAAFAMRQSRFRGGVRTDENVHDPHEFRERLGRRIPQAGRDEHAMLDRGPPTRTFTVVGQSVDPNGGATQRH